MPTTGIAGLTLGGGIAAYVGKHGLAADNLLSADLVTAEGKLVTVSAWENEDLFWGLRGGGGNFGVVTSFEFQLHRVGEIRVGWCFTPLTMPRTSSRLLPILREKPRTSWS